MAFSLHLSSFAAGEISPAMRGRADFAKWKVALATCRNCFVHPEGGASNRPGTKYISPAHDEAHRVRLLPFVKDNDDSYVLEFGHLYMRPIRNGGLVLYPAGHAQEGDIVSIETPYASSDLPTLRFDASGDVVYLRHTGYAPQRLERHDHHDWRLIAETFAPTLSPPSGVSGSASSGSGTTWRYVLTAEAENGEESLPSSEISVNGPSALSSTATITISGTPPAGSVKMNAYRYKNGSFGFIGSTETTSFTDDNISPDNSDTPPKEKNPFADGNHPGTVAFFEQREVNAGSDSKRDTVWTSKSGAWKNFTVSEPVKDSDAVTFTLAARKVYRILHLVALRVLLIFTEGSVWAMRGAGDSDPISATSILCRMQSERGAGLPPPIVVDDTVLYVTSMLSRVRELRYDLSSDGYPSQDRSVLARHLFRKRTISEWAYAEEPDGIIWCVMSDGALLGFTYLREHEVYAWHRHDSQGGRFESVVTVPESGVSAIYVSVVRTINGAERRYIERMAERIDDDISEAWFLDCALRYDGAPADVITGLDHLEGKTVAVLADGSREPDCVVDGGQIALQGEFSKVLVGLSYDADLENMGLDVQSQQGSIQGKLKTVPMITLLLQKTRGLKVGQKVSDLKPLKELVRNWGTSPEPEDFDAKITLPPGWKTDGRVFIRQPDPYPMTVLGIVPEVEIGG